MPARKSWTTLGRAVYTPSAPSSRYLVGGRRTRRKARDQGEAKGQRDIETRREWRSKREYEQKGRRSQGPRSFNQPLSFLAAFSEGEAPGQAGANGTQLNDWYQRAPPVALAGMSRTRWRSGGLPARGPTLDSSLEKSRPRPIPSH